MQFELFILGTLACTFSPSSVYIIFQNIPHLGSKGLRGNRKLREQIYKALWKKQLPDNQKPKFNPGIITIKRKFLSKSEFLFLHMQN